MTKQARRTVLALLSLALLIAGLHLAARLGLRGPTGLSASEFGTWFDDPVAAAATIFRWLALALAYYLLVAVAAIGLIEGGDGEPSGPLRRLIPSGVSSAIGLVLGIGVPLVSATVHASTTDLVVPEQPETLQLVAVEDPLVLTERSTDLPIPGSEPRQHLAPTLVDSFDEETWVVESGDSFWSIAEETLIDHGEASDSLTDETIAAYWRVLMDANEERLIEPGNPDLIMPGQEMTLPPISRGMPEG